MAKRTGNSSVNSSIRQQTKSNEQGLTQLLVVQQQSLGHLSTIQSLMEKTANLKDDEMLKVQQESLSVQKKQLKVLEESDSDRKQAQEAIQKLMDGMKSFKSPLERMKEGVQGVKSKFSGENIKKSFLESTNIMGINNKRLEKDKFIKEQKALGAEGDLGKKFEGAYAAKKESSKVEEKIQKLREATGGKYTDEELAKSPANSALFEKKAALTEEYSQFDIGAKLKVADKASMVSKSAEAVSETPTAAFASAGEQQEAAQEDAKLMAEQTSLLVKIEENTRGGDAAKPSTSSESGGGLLGGIGAGLKSLGKGIQGLMGGAGRGIAIFLKGLATGLSALANPKALLGLGALTLALMGIGKALQMAAPFMEAFAPVLIKVADVIQNVFVEGIKAIPEIIKSIGDVIMGVISAISDSIIGIIDAVTSSIERLAEIDGSSLLSVGAGLVAVAAGMVAFGAGAAATGVGNLVGGLLGAVTPGGSAIDQIMKLGASGENIEKAGIGVEKLASGLKGFSAIDTDKIKAIAALPVEKIAAMGAAMGNAGMVNGKSAENRALDAQAGNSGGGSTAIVNAPTTNVTKQTQVIKSPIRNQESSQSKYLYSRYA